jgi:hypothetical protein
VAITHSKSTMNDKYASQRLTQDVVEFSVEHSTALGYNFDECDAVLCDGPLIFNIP